jgi:hypothetical protein
MGVLACLAAGILLGIGNTAAGLVILAVGCWACVSSSYTLFVLPRRLRGTSKGDAKPSED